MTTNSSSGQGLRRVGLINPGQMGVTIGQALRAAGSEVLWASAGRGESSKRRASQAGLVDAGDLAALTARSSVIFSVCPPESALEVAEACAAQGFSGTYVDLNAISPERARRIARTVQARGARFIDGGIIGPPATRAGTTRVYLSGEGAADIAALFAGSLVDAHVVNDQPGAASALKMAYAAYTKGTSALLIAIRALARAEGVEQALVDEWNISIKDMPARTEDAAAKNAFKAWRFVGEMEEIAETFAANRLPAGFHRGAADLYRFLDSFKDVTPAPSLSEVLDVIDERRKQ